VLLLYDRKGIAIDRLVGFEDLGSKDDFSTRALENILKRKGRDRIVTCHTMFLRNLNDKYANTRKKM
jgi:hypothetical protein